MTRPASRREEGLYQRIAEIIERARGHVARSVNSAMGKQYRRTDPLRERPVRRGKA